MPGSRWDTLNRRDTIVFAAAGIGLALMAAFVTLHAAGDDEIGAALRRMIAVIAPIAVGLYAWRHPPHQRFGRLLCALGVLWFVALLAASEQPTVYSIGRVAGWAAEFFLLYVVLAFPTGRLLAPIDRRLAFAGAALLALLYIPSAFLVESFPVPASFTPCVDGCPANAFNVVGFEPYWIDAVVRPLREALTVLLAIAVIGRLAWRVTTAPGLLQRTLAPVLVVAIARLLVLAAVLVARSADASSEVVATLAEAALLGVALISAAFLLGLLGWRIYVAETLQGLATPVSSHLRTAQLRDAVAKALGDPTLEIALRSGDGWVDAAGRPLRVPAKGSGRTLTEGRDRQRSGVAIIHDDVLMEQRAFVEAVTTYATLSVDNERLEKTVRESARALAKSRARLVAAADEERRRIARDLHDGAQQRLIALRIRLELAADLVERDPQRATEQLEELGDEATATLDELRNLATGVFPPLLADRGLGEALRQAARRCPVPARVELGDIGRYPRPVESAVYFCCLEALQNAAKHAPHASEIVVALSNGDELHFEVRDDGPGFDARHSHNGNAGAGLVNMRDRLEAVDGVVTIESAPGRGTRVAGHIPLKANESRDGRGAR